MVSSSPCPYVPLRPSVLTLHDLSPWMNREWHQGAGRVRKRTPHLIKLGIATMIRDPHGSRAQLRRSIFFGSILRASWQFIWPRRPISCPSKRNRVERPYFVYVGVIEPRKNVLALIEAWSVVRKRHNVDLVIAGRCASDATPLVDQPGLQVLGEVAELRTAGAILGRCGVCLSFLYEGFGLPILEAMQCGTAVITLAMLRYGSLCKAQRSTSTHLAWRKPWKDCCSTKKNGCAGAGYHSNAPLSFPGHPPPARTREVYVEAIRRFHA